MSGKHELGDEPIEPDLRAIAGFLDRALNGNATGHDREVGFVLLMFQYGEHLGRCDFVSNGAARADLVALFKEMIRRFEDEPEIKGHA